ncbi:MAG: hypothetical protein Unbinned5081contig1001_58 [Prokaryotic dsDNA virus sp.]|nr:MAG: hypothetical protein Unbinned5081contig1001_58 [Prokaryotic dsDNA virus sp.]|tara:strand:+ start:10267 stop:10581 length:315 start_codon:yes stop_codon:yes gene_type:complete
MSYHNGIWEAVLGIKEQLSVLVFSGFGGAVFRAILAPEEKWKRRITQATAGAMSALFLGGAFASLIQTLTSADGAWPFLAAGFLCGAGGEAAVKSLQNRMMGTK